MRAKAAAKKKAAEARAEKRKRYPPLEQARAQAAARQGGNGAKPSPLELAREQVPAAESLAGMVPEDSGKTINFSPEQAAILANHAAHAEVSANAAGSNPDGAIVVPCPECEHELKLPDKSLLGRKARCPMCSFKFVLEVAEEPEPVAA